MNADESSFTGMWQAVVTSILGRWKAVHHVNENCLVTWKGGRLLCHIWKEVMCSEEKEPETLKCPGIGWTLTMKIILVFFFFTFSSQ